MPYSIITGNAVSLADQLNGTVLLGPIPPMGVPVGGRTLIFTQPSATTVTFGGSAGSYRTAAQIVADITSQLAAANPVKRTGQYGPPSVDASGRIGPDVFVALQNDTSGIAITNAGTANAYLGVGAGVTGAPLDPTKLGPVATDAAGRFYIAIILP